MSVDYFAWVGYGYTGVIDDEDDLLRESKVPAEIRAAIDLEDVEGEMEKWLEARGIDLVIVTVSGNSYSGVERWNVHVKRCTASVDEMEPLEFLEMPTESEVMQLGMAAELLRLEGEPAWMMQMDVQ